MKKVKIKLQKKVKTVNLWRTCGKNVKKMQKTSRKCKKLNKRKKQKKKKEKGEVKKN